MDTGPVIAIAALIVVCALFFAIFWFAARRGLLFGQPPGQGYAPGWHARCPDCGATKPAGEVGMIFLVGFRQVGPRKTVTGWCDTCEKEQIWSVEPIDQ